MVLSKDESARIEAAIRDCEQKTSGEIVVAVLERSDAYVAPRFITAAIAAAALASLVLWRWPHIASLIVLMVQAPLFAIVWLVSGLGPLQRGLAGKQAMEHAVEARADRIFTRSGVHATRDRTGVLILLSRLERRVVIRADIGIDAAMVDDGWRKHVSAIVDAVHAGKPVDGIVKVIGDITTVLADKFPRRADDVNELPNSIVES